LTAVAPEPEHAQVTVIRIVPNIEVSSVAVARRLYGDLLGMGTAMDHGWIATLAAPSAAEVQLSVMAHDETAPVVASVSIQVDNLDEVYAAAVAIGLEIVHPLTVEPWGVRRFFFCDPDGNVLNILEHV
jgi:catechol 2,3-dioxygenase-like lactoylglutathione lyase family enzyme